MKYSVFSVILISCILAMAGCLKEDPAEPDEVKDYKLSIDESGVADIPIQATYVYKDVVNTRPVYVTGFGVEFLSPVTNVTLNRYKVNVSLPKVGEVRNLLDKDMNVNSVLSEQIARLAPVYMNRASENYTLPYGIALRLDGGIKLDMGVYSVDPTATGTERIKADLILHTTTATPDAIALPLYFVNSLVKIPQGTSVQSFTYAPSDAINVFMLTSFSSKYMTNFKVSVVRSTGVTEEVYSSDNFNLPIVKSFSSALLVDFGDKLRMDVTYFNPEAREVRFGLGTGDDFSGVFGYYYAATQKP